MHNAICTGKLEYPPIAVNELKLFKKYTNRPVKITLPGPYLLTRSMWIANLSKVAYDSKEALGQAAADILCQEIDQLQAIGVDIIQFDEPVLTEVVFTGRKNAFIHVCGAFREERPYRRVGLCEVIATASVGTYRSDPNDCFAACLPGQLESRREHSFDGTVYTASRCVQGC
ncbi:MAG: hypothetical protein Q4A55_01770 [Aerococcus sp.]|nr:hypothetical protein [Aerococcus sp.]